MRGTLGLIKVKDVPKPLDCVFCAIGWSEGEIES